MLFAVMQWFSFYFVVSGLELEHSKLPTEQPKLQNIAYPFKWKRESCVCQLRMFTLMELTPFQREYDLEHVKLSTTK